MSLPARWSVASGGESGLGNAISTCRMLPRQPHSCWVVPEVESLRPPFSSPSVALWRAIERALSASHSAAERLDLLTAPYQAVNCPGKEGVFQGRLSDSESFRRPRGGESESDGGMGECESAEVPTLRNVYSLRVPLGDVHSWC